jgi:hypothetical protein
MQNLTNAYIFSDPHKTFYALIPNFAQDERAYLSKDKLIMIPCIKKLNFQCINSVKQGEKVKWVSGMISSISLEKIKELIPKGKFNLEAYYNVNSRRYGSRQSSPNEDTTVMDLDEKEAKLSSLELISSQLTAHHKKHVYVFVPGLDGSPVGILKVDVNPASTHVFVKSVQTDKEILD